MQLSIDKEVEFILREMFKRVNLEYDSELVRQPDWYYKASWTRKQEADFINWLSKYLKRIHPYLSKQRAAKEAASLVFHIGWITDGDTTQLTPEMLHG